jgi:RNA polymerase sigma-70 factor (ECF subfamily)
MIPWFLATIEDVEERELLIGLYQKHRFTMLHVARSILHSDDLAEDAVQEAFYRLLRNTNPLRAEPQQARAFLVTIVRHIAIDVVKRQKTIPMISLDDIVYEPADSFDVEDFVMRQEELNDIEQLVLSLPIHYSTVFLLKYKHDCSDGDIAHLLNITESTVRKRLQRAKEKITELVSGETSYKKSNGF